MQPVSEIQDLNPSLLHITAPAGFEVHVPKGSGQAAELALESVPAENRRAWRLHRVEAGDTLQTIARTYHLAPERIVAVNRAADSLEAGDVLFIPAVYHEERPARRVRTRRTGSKTTASATSRRVPAQVLHRKAAVRTASLGQ